MSINLQAEIFTNEMFFIAGQFFRKTTFTAFLRKEDENKQRMQLAELLLEVTLPYPFFFIEKM